MNPRIPQLLPCNQKVSAYVYPCTSIVVEDLLAFSVVLASDVRTLGKTSSKHQGGFALLERGPAPAMYTMLFLAPLPVTSLVLLHAPKHLSKNRRLHPAMRK